MSNWNRVTFYGLDADRPATPDPANGTSQAWVSTDTQEIRQSVISGAALAWQKVADAGSGGGDYILVQDRKTSGSFGGSNSTGTWQTRDLNTVVSDSGGHASVGGNQLTLGAGTYRATIQVPGYGIANFTARLYNVSDSAVQQGTGGFEMYGSAGVSLVTDGGNTFSVIRDRFTIAGSKVFEVQMYSATVRATAGLGNAGDGGGPEIYTVIELLKE